MLPGLEMILLRVRGTLGPLYCILGIRASDQKLVAMGRPVLRGGVLSSIIQAPTFFGVRQPCCRE
jgi:hypothetical protein